jgi:acetylornithine deacetylase/succinyl-diaminopimelate desuccinylase-like protein
VNAIQSVQAKPASIGPDTARAILLDRIAAQAGDVVAIAQGLIGIPSENPSGDTRAVAQHAADMLSRIEGVDVELVVGREPFVNVVARARGARAGRRLVLNGHLDTFPIGDKSSWTVDPFGGAVVDGKLYGRGACDMKGGLAASMAAFRLLAGMREDWDGELVLTLAADEETMGRWGSAYLLEHVPHARGDALICGDAGSPKVIRFGEKGMVWLELTAKGRSSHGAHVHLGKNALDLLIEAILSIQSLTSLRVDTPETVRRAIEQARSVSEPLAGAGETDVLTAVTVNLGILQGGISPNLVPSSAHAMLDIRLPLGVSADAMVRKITDLVDLLDGVEAKILVRHDPTASDPDGELFKLLVRNGADAMGVTPVLTMRVGASDTRLFRAQGIPSAVFGCTPHSMGGPDEYVTVEDLQTVFKVHALTAFDFLTADHGVRKNGPGSR